MSEELKKGCVVFLKASSGLVGYGNAQCVREVHHKSLGTIGLYGHNQHYKTDDIEKVVECPDAELQKNLEMWRAACGVDEKRIEELQAENAKLKEEYIEAENQIKEYQVEIAELEDKIEAYSNQGE